MRPALCVAIAAAACAGAAAASPLRFEPAQAHAAVALLGEAPSHGLDADDYGHDALAEALRAQAPHDAIDPALAARLAEALRRYLDDLHFGHLRSAVPGAGDLPRPTDRFDAAETLRAALALGELALAVHTAEPALPQYARLREALARYRTLAAHPAWRDPLPALPTPRRRVDPGGDWAGTTRLAVRLAALGDLAPGDTDSAGARLDALRRFQRRHGLAGDGVIGRATLAALEVTPAQRVRQLELALERLRSLRLPAASRLVVVNLPEFRLRAYEQKSEAEGEAAGEGGRYALRLSMRVIVGRALDTRTPLLQAAMRRIEFKPYWNVPDSIARGELLPQLAREPARWVREGYEFIDARGVADAVLADHKLRAVLDGRLRIRQRPGPRNALGDIKFVFPNREAIYLHHTPQTALFERTRRDFSHGCIRVEAPVALARFALDGQAGWDEPRIRDAMATGRPRAVALARELPVLLVHATAVVADGELHFFDDLYGHDRALDEALRRRRAPP